MSKLKIFLADAFVNFADKLNARADKYRFKPYNCPVCKNQLTNYVPYHGFAEPMQHMTRISIFTLETFNFLQYWCPSCRANDRDRLYALYLRELFGKLDKSKKYTFIDFSPETISLANFIKSQPFLKYRSADLFMPDVDDTVDLQDMRIYADNSVDFFICSHMLEHVPDDRKSMAELYRILKPGGRGIAMVPIDLSREDTFENPSIQTEEERWRYFGQNDHLRVYSKLGFTGRLKEAGFSVEELGVNHFGPKNFREAGIYPRSVLYIIEK